MAMLLKIAALALVGFIVLAEATPKRTPLFGLDAEATPDGTPLFGLDAEATPHGIRVARNDKHHLGLGGGHKLGGGLGGLTGGLGKATATATATAASSADAGGDDAGNDGGLRGAAAGLAGAGAGGNRGGAGSKVVVDIKNKQNANGNANGGCKCGNPQLDEFMHNLSLALRAYTSKELVPELKKVATKFVDYVMDYLMKEKPNEMASVHSFLENSARVTGNRGGAGAVSAVAVSGASAGTQ